MTTLYFVLCTFHSPPSPFYCSYKQMMLDSCAFNNFALKEEQRLVLCVNPWGDNHILYCNCWETNQWQISTPVTSPGVTGPPYNSVGVGWILLSYVHAFMSLFPSYIHFTQQGSFFPLQLSEENDFTSKTFFHCWELVGEKFVSPQGESTLRTGKPRNCHFPGEKQSQAFSGWVK